MRRFYDVFRKVNETLKLEESSERDAERDAEQAKRYAAAGAVYNPIIGAWGIPDVQVSLGTVSSGTISGAAFGANLSSAEGDSAEEGEAFGTSLSSAEGDHAEEELWKDLCALDSVQLTAVLEDANAILFSHREMVGWLQWRRKFYDQHLRFNPYVPVEWRRNFVPAYADIFHAVDECMDKKEAVEPLPGSWEFMRRVLVAICPLLLENGRFVSYFFLSFYEIAIGAPSFVLSLELSSWARYNLWAYLVLHSAAFFNFLWMCPASLLTKNEGAWNGNIAETDLLLVSIAVQVRKLKEHPSSFPQISLIDLLKDARCVRNFNATIWANVGGDSSSHLPEEDRDNVGGPTARTGLSSLIPPECPYGTATILVPASEWDVLSASTRIGSLAAWQVPAWGGGDDAESYSIRLPTKPEPNPSNSKP